MAKKLSELFAASKSNLASYVPKALKSASHHDHEAGINNELGIKGAEAESKKKADQRRTGVMRAFKKVQEDAVDKLMNDPTMTRLAVNKSRAAMHDMGYRRLEGGRWMHLSRIARHRRAMREGLVYDDGGPGHKAPFHGVSDNADANKAWETHNSNHFILSHFHKHGTANEKMQAAKELPKAENKMKFWEKHPRFDRKKADAHTALMKKTWSSVKEETIMEDDGSDHALYKAGKHSWKKDAAGKVVMTPVKHWAIHHGPKKEVVATGTTRHGAQKSADKRNKEYGAHKYNVDPVFEENNMKEGTVNAIGAPKKLRNVLNAKLYMGNTQDEQNILDKRDENTKHNEDMNGNGDDFFNGAAVKVSATKANAAARPKDAEMYDDWIGEDVQSEALGSGIGPNLDYKMYHFRANKGLLGHQGEIGAKDNKGAIKHVHKLISDDGHNPDHFSIHIGREERHRDKDGKHLGFTNSVVYHKEAGEKYEV